MFAQNMVLVFIIYIKTIDIKILIFNKEVIKLESTKDTIVKFVVGLAALMAIGMGFKVVEDIPSLIGYIAFVIAGGFFLMLMVGQIYAIGGFIVDLFKGKSK